jgi:hypothetical protein
MTSSKNLKGEFGFISKLARFFVCRKSSTEADKVSAKVQMISAKVETILTQVGMILTQVGTISS